MTWIGTFDRVVGLVAIFALCSAAVSEVDEGTDPYYGFREFGGGVGGEGGHAG